MTRKQLPDRYYTVTRFTGDKYRVGVPTEIAEVLREADLGVRWFRNKDGNITVTFGKPSGKAKYWNRERVVEAFQRFQREHGRPPKSSELKPANGLPGQKTLSKVVGGYYKALEAAGMEPVPRPPRWTDEAIIERIQRFYAERGELPTNSRLKEAGLPTEHTLRSRFGGLSGAVRAAGFEPRRSGERNPPPQPARERFEGWIFDDREGHRRQLRERKQ